jgi:hypothetical protein
MKGRMAMTTANTPAVVVTTTANGSRLHKHGCRNAKTARPVELADSTPTPRKSITWS